MEQCDPYSRDDKVGIVSEMIQICKLPNKEFYGCFPTIAKILKLLLQLCKGWKEKTCVTNEKRRFQRN